MDWKDFLFALAMAFIVVMVILLTIKTVMGVS